VYDFDGLITSSCISNCQREFQDATASPLCRYPEHCQINRRMPMKRVVLGFMFLVLGSVSSSGQRAAILRDVKAVQVNATVVANPEKVKEDFAANLMQNSLRNALRNANFETPETAPIRAHIVLDEFSSGSTAKRFVVGFGAGRSTVDGRLVFQDETGKELANVRIRVRGNLAWSAYQGGNRQRAQATNAFDQRLSEEIARLK
jgi:hypothetical protein